MHVWKKLHVFWHFSLVSSTFSFKNYIFCSGDVSYCSWNETNILGRYGAGILPHFQGGVLQEILGKPLMCKNVTCASVVPSSFRMSHNKVFFFFSVLVKWICPTVVESSDICDWSSCADWFFGFISATVLFRWWKEGLSLSWRSRRQLKGNGRCHWNTLTFGLFSVAVQIRGFRFAEIDGGLFHLHRAGRLDNWLVSVFLCSETRNLLPVVSVDANEFSSLTSAQPRENSSEIKVYNSPATSPQTCQAFRLLFNIFAFQLFSVGQSPVWKRIVIKPGTVIHFPWTAIPQAHCIYCFTQLFLVLNELQSTCQKKKKNQMSNFSIICISFLTNGVFLAETFNRHWAGGNSHWCLPCCDII